MQNENTYADWFRRLLWVGILANMTFAIPAIFLPETLSNYLGFDPSSEPTWLQKTGILRVILNLFYMPVATEPFQYAIFARLSVTARFVAAAFFLWLIWRWSPSGNVWPLFIVDFALGCLLGFTLRRAFRVQDEAAFVMRRSFVSRFFSGMWRFINGPLHIQWHWLFRYVGSMNLWGIRTDLREHNLHVTSDLTSVNKCPLGNFPDYERHRTPDGSNNDLEHPCMGRSGERFARNAPHGMAWPDQEKLLTPNPREISLRLMTREEFIPASTLNLLAAAWIQFQNHGWFNHERDDARKIEIPLHDNDSWVDQHGQPKMEVSATQPDSTRPDDATSLPTFQNTESHWWDGSQIYGATLKKQMLLRSGHDGKMKILEN